MTTPREEMLRTCRLLMRPGDVHEVRIPKAGRLGTVSGYCDSVELIVDAILRLDGHVPGITLHLTLSFRHCSLGPLIGSANVRNLRPPTPAIVGGVGRDLRAAHR